MTRKTQDEIDRTQDSRCAHGAIGGALGGCDGTEASWPWLRRRPLDEEFSSLPDAAEVTRVMVRLLLAALLGGIVGYEREHKGKAAGLRTHMLVAMGAALFVLVPERGGMGIADMSRVIQGVVDRKSTRLNSSHQIISYAVF